MAKKVIFLLSITLLVGCATSKEICDPKNKNLGLLDKMSCNFSGHYEERIEDKKKILLDEQKANQQFKDLYASIAKQNSDTSLTIKQKQAEQIKMENTLAQLTNEIKSKAKDRDDLQDHVKDIDNQMNKVKNSSKSEIEKQVELDKLNQKLQKLQKALNL